MKQKIFTEVLRDLDWSWAKNRLEFQPPTSAVSIPFFWCFLWICLFCLIVPLFESAHLLNFQNIYITLNLKHLILSGVLVHCSSLLIHWNFQNIRITLNIQQNESSQICMSFLASWSTIRVCSSVGTFSEYLCHPYPYLHPLCPLFLFWIHFFLPFHHSSLSRRFLETPTIQMNHLLKFACPYWHQGCSRQFRSQGGCTYHICTCHRNCNVVTPPPRPNFPEPVVAGPSSIQDQDLNIASISITPTGECFKFIRPFISSNPTEKTIPPLVDRWGFFFYHYSFSVCWKKDI